MKVVKGFNVYDLVRAAGICLVPNVVIPKGFRVQVFVKYIGLECPNTYPRSYCNKMAEVVHDDMLLILFFQDSLISFVLS